MYLLRTKSRHHEEAQLFDCYQDATEEAKKFVGDHNPDDGCSSPPNLFATSRPRFRVWRSTSFGTRSAMVDEVSTLERKEVMSW